MYEYLDRKPEAGDIVECQTEDINSFSKNKLYICKKLEDTMLFTELDDKGSTTNGVHPKHFKVVKTLHEDQAKVGDTCIRTGSSANFNQYNGSKMGDVFNVTHLSGDWIGYKPSYEMAPDKARVLCLANAKPKAYYKRSGKPWTAEEIAQILNPWNPKYADYNLQNKWVYPSISGQNEYFPWSEQTPEKYPECYNLASFEDEFPNIETLPITIPIGSYWQEMYTSTSKGPIVEVIKLGTETVHFENLGTDQRRSKTLSNFLNKFVPIPKPTLEAYRPGAQSEPTQCQDMLTSLTRALKPLHKEQPMTFQQLIHSIFQEEIQTDYDKKPNFLVVIYNNEGTEIAQATANSVKQVEDKIQSTPKLWGCSTVMYKIDKELKTSIPVLVTKVKTNGTEN